MAEAAKPQSSFAAGLRKALAADEIEILFQPQVEIASGRIVGAEALARWQQPDLGELGAETLFGLASRAAMLRDLSEHVQERALCIAAGWPSALDLRLSVNITAADAVRPDFASSLFVILQECGFERSRLTIEITETELIENLDAAAEMLAHLRDSGIRVALDDFGTGYSSLLYLKALPLDAIKIDKRLMEDIAGSDRDRVVVAGTIDMARKLGLEVIAEGVETQEQLRLLREEGCDLYQGFLCSPPVDSATLTELVSR
ncbi:MAG TPA: EAL domain-containing protein [Allosphingosinicella sp.]|uniref:EAL domain-containing protein n=1 Tax=Allosphingosinicella sp. TaxID=2823234 RepID=UPI002ED87ADB